MRMLKALVLSAVVIAALAVGSGPRGAEKKAVQDLFIFAPTELAPGGEAAFRVVVMKAMSLTESEPLRGARVKIVLADKQGTSHELVDAKTDEQGTISETARIPRLDPEREYELVVTASSGLGETEKRHSVGLVSNYRILLSTDKPLYQPNQLIHIRAVALNLGDLHPMAEKDITLTVEDPQSNKVFKKVGKTDKYGIFAGDFQLADEIRLGDYKIAAEVEGQESEKLVTVKKYVLPKFKVVLDTGKTHYRPGEKLSGTVSADYFFGKPVDGAQVKITAQAFDVEFHTVAEVSGKTNGEGKFEFEVTLPDTFVGQPLEQGDAFIKLDAEVTDLAEHKETATVERKVAAADLRLELVPEAGRLIPGVENTIYAVVTTPDDKPVPARVKLTAGGESVTGATNDSGIAAITFTPEPGDFTVGSSGGYVLAVSAEAEDFGGRKVEVSRELGADALKDTILLRPDRALYRSGDEMKVTVLGTFRRGSVYLDLIKDRRPVVTRSLEFADGRAATEVALGPDLFGTVEVHAYVILPSGEIMRDSRVVYIEPASDLRISASLDKDTYRPGEEAKLVFTVTDAKGAGHAAAIGLSIVDESVFAIQEMQPGLLKVYFTLEKELAKPRYEVHFSPEGESVESLIQEPEKSQAKRDEIMKVLLAGVKDPTKPGWEENPAKERIAGESQKIQQFASYLFTYITTHDFLMQRDGVWLYRADLVETMLKDGAVTKEFATDSFGDLYEPEIVKSLDGSLTLETVASGVASNRLLMLYQAIHRDYNENEKSWVDKMFDGGPAIGEIPKGIVKKLVEKKFLDAGYAKDPWGNDWSIERLEKEQGNPYNAIFNNFSIKSAGPDGKAGTADDVADPYLFYNIAYLNWLGGGMGIDDRGWVVKAMEGAGDMMRRENLAMPMAAPPMMKNEMAKGGKDDFGAPAGNGGDGAKPVRVREYFPETLLWAPDIITDGDGRAVLTVPMADSITTWRMTGLAHSADGLLGSMTDGIRVFQDFFVDIDFPVQLTQGDEVEVPVAVYNYLPGSQTVTLEVREHPGFELLSDATVKLDLAADQVDVRYFRVKADKPGSHSLTVYATGSKLSDAIKRTVEVVPDGMRFEVVKNGRLTGPLSEDIEIPTDAIDDASRVMVKIYPGVFAQVLEGMDGIFRMPSGCFEQTTSTTYPNIMVLSYMKKTKTVSPEIQMTAEGYINIGYQRLLSFEVPGGGFEWFGNPPAHPVLTAYGLMEFYDMSKVHDIDENVITRTQEWLAELQEDDGSWKPVEHWLETLSGEDFSKSVDLNTAYITWSLAETGYQGEATKKGVKYLKAHLKDINDAYTLALAVNALVSVNPKDPDAKNVLGRLEKLAIEDAKTGTVHWEPKGKTAVYGAGNSAKIETTSLILYAMIKAKQSPAMINKGLAWISQQKDAFGTFESTQATVLAFKVLLLSQEGTAAEVNADLAVLLGDRSDTVKITPQTSDVLRLVDFKDQTKEGANKVEIKNAPADTGLMYQIVGIYYIPWDKIEKMETPPLLALDVKYDRNKLKTDDILTANVTAEYKGDKATDMVLLDLGIPPGFTLIPDGLDAVKEKDLIEKYTATGRQITVYVRRMERGKALSFSYQLKAKFPVKAQTPKSTAYEYYNPDVRIESRPTPIEVTR